ncbi:hypothetical protein BGZ73_001250 [Actinomortierella ambigua]|nr:hypothetical protein BGZ73_001250 [Actinomortierella ambigua]
MVTSKFYYALARDRTVWRIKCREHMLFSTRHLYAQPSVDWFAYYRYLHRNSRALDRNWSQATPQSVTVLEGHTSLVTSVELSLWTLVTASIDSTVRVWNLRTMECIQVLRCKHSITCVSQCDSIGAVCGRTSFGALIIWDIKTGQMVLQDNDACPNIASYMFMDERYIGYGTNDGSVTIFDWSSRSELEIAGSYHEHTGDIIYVSILNMEIVMSASTNGETLLYSLAKRRIIGRFLLPGAAQAVQCTPTICGNKVMFSTQDTIYEYELDLQDIVASFNQEKQLEEKMMLEAKHGLKISNTSKSFQSSSLSSPSSYSSSLSSPSMPSPPTNTRLGPHFQTSSVVGSSPRQWKPSNSLLSQIRQKIGTAKLMALSLGETESSSHSPSSDLSSPSSHSSSSPLPTTAPLSSTYRTASSLSSPMTAAGASSTPKSVPATTEPMMPTIPTRFPRSTSLYCLPPGSRMLDHGTTSARLSFGVFMRQGCESLRDMAVYSGKTRRLQTWSGAAVDRMLRDAVRSHYYTTMECNEHCVAISSGDKIYVVSFLPTDV